MTFRSILFLSAEDRPPSEALPAPDFFVDSNIDQVVAAIAKGKEEYNLTPFFRWPLHDVDAASYRHEVMRDLEDVVVFDKINDSTRQIGRNEWSVRGVDCRRERHSYSSRCYGFDPDILNLRAKGGADGRWERRGLPHANPRCARRSFFVRNK